MVPGVAVVVGIMVVVGVVVIFGVEEGILKVVIIAGSKMILRYYEILNA